MTQREWVVAYLMREGGSGDFVLNMAREWNRYKSKTIGLHKPCGYDAFRKLINDMKRDGIIESIPKEEKTESELDSGTMFERSYYRVSKRYMEKIRKPRV
jgi:hypothetical protein